MLLEIPPTTVAAVFFQVGSDIRHVTEMGVVQIEDHFVAIPLFTQKTGNEIEGLVNFIEPTILLQGKGERKIEVRTHRTEAMVGKDEVCIVTQQDIQLLVFEIEVRFCESISPGIAHMVESVVKQFFSASKGVQTDTTMEPPVAFFAF